MTDKASFNILIVFLDFYFSIRIYLTHILYSMNKFFDYRIQEMEERNEEFIGPAESYSFEARVETSPKLVRTFSQ